MLDALHGPGGEGFEEDQAGARDWWQPGWPIERFKHWLESYCLRNVMYTYERDPTFKMGEAHSVSSAVCPAHWEEEIMSRYCNYVEVNSTKEWAGPSPPLTLTVTITRIGGRLHQARAGPSSPVRRKQLCHLLVGPRSTKAGRQRQEADAGELQLPREAHRA